MELIGIHYYFLPSKPRGEGGSKYQGMANGWRSAALEFPDLSRLRFWRPSATPGSWEQQTIDLRQALERGNCTKDVTLEWGDNVEIPIADHVLNEPWKGFDLPTLLSLKNCLSRKTNVVVKGKTNVLTLAPDIVFPYISSDPRPPDITTRTPFWIKPVLLESKLLLASSDLARIKVIRTDRVTGQEQEYVLDCSESKSAPDFWLREGDTIEVPDKE